MKWLRNIFYSNKEHVKSAMEISVDKLLESMNDAKGLKEDINKNKESLKGLEGSLSFLFQSNYHKTIDNIEQQLNSVRINLNSEIVRKVSVTEKLILGQLENQRIKDLNEIKESTKLELSDIRTEVGTLVEILRPKAISLNFKLLDPLNVKYEIFSFQKLNELSQIPRKQKVEDGSSILRSFMGAIPELTAVGILTHSYRFDFPNGLAGQVIQMGSGQGTALMQNGKIIAHGSYVSNALIAAPLAVFGIANMIVRQHYLNKIHEKLRAIETSLDTLIKLVFIDKRAKIDSIIYFFKKSLHEFDQVSSNQNYRNAILTNIVSKNIEIYELIQFYANSLQESANYKTHQENDQFEYRLKSFILLQDLFLQGKILSFMYANLYSRELTENVNSEIIDLASFYSQVLNKNKEKINCEFDRNKSKWNDWLHRRKSKKETIRHTATQDLISIDYFKRDVKENFTNGKQIINDLLFQIEKSQSFLIEEGELFQIN